mgnify:CR=1 FL=1
MSLDPDKVKYSLKYFHLVLAYLVKIRIRSQIRVKIKMRTNSNRRLKFGGFIMFYKYIVIGKIRIQFHICSKELDMDQDPGKIRYYITSFDPGIPEKLLDLIKIEMKNNSNCRFIGIRTCIP